MEQTQPYLIELRPEERPLINWNPFASIVLLSIVILSPNIPFPETTTTPHPCQSITFYTANRFNLVRQFSRAIPSAQFWPPP